MNIYARFFNQDVLVKSIDELLSFLNSISEIEITEELADDIKKYIESDMPYPKRYKIRPRIYFILIKTNAESMEEFKAKKKEDNNSLDDLLKKEHKLPLLMESRKGWYKGVINFKRVINIPGTTKFQYQDTSFEALVFSDSANECYQKIVSFLQERQDIDKRSQYPSAKGNNFSYMYMGEEIPEEFQHLNK